LEHRLKRQRDFDLVFKKGKRAFTGAVAMYYVDNVKSAVKIGISVSKKHGSAVQRNRIKRLLRAAYIPLIPQITKNAYIVFVPRVRESYEFSEIAKSVGFLLKKENFL
jgi:ribonuclease P protein component